MEAEAWWGLDGAAGSGFEDTDEGTWEEASGLGCKARGDRRR